MDEHRLQPRKRSTPWRIHETLITYETFHSNHLNHSNHFTHPRISFHAITYCLSIQFKYEKNKRGRDVWMDDSCTQMIWLVMITSQSTFLYRHIYSESCQFYNIIHTSSSGQQSTNYVDLLDTPLSFRVFIQLAGLIFIK